MKRDELVRELLRQGCVLLRHGGRHDIYLNPVTGQKAKNNRFPGTTKLTMFWPNISRSFLESKSSDLSKNTGVCDPDAERCFSTAIPDFTSTQGDFLRGTFHPGCGPLQKGGQPGSVRIVTGFPAINIAGNTYDCMDFCL